MAPGGESAELHAQRMQILLSRLRFFTPGGMQKGVRKVFFQNKNGVPFSNERIHGTVPEGESAELHVKSEQNLLYCTACLFLF